MNRYQSFFTRLFAIVVVLALTVTPAMARGRGHHRGSHHRSSGPSRGWYNGALVVGATLGVLDIMSRTYVASKNPTYATPVYTNNYCTTTPVYSTPVYTSGYCTTPVYTTNYYTSTPVYTSSYYRPTVVYPRPAYGPVRRPAYRPAPPPPPRHHAPAPAYHHGNPHHGGGHPAPGGYRGGMRPGVQHRVWR